MQQSGDEAVDSRTLEHPGQNMKDRPKPQESINRRKETRRPKLQHLGRIKLQGPPRPGLGQPVKLA